jgi:CO/xanthine dehydrogenase Mo-binding subunit
VRVTVDPDSGRVTVEKLWLVADAGTIVHPDGVLAQMQGGALWGLKVDLQKWTEIVAGEVRDHNFDTYALLRMRDVPDMQIEFVTSTEAPVGLGKPGRCPISGAPTRWLRSLTHRQQKIQGA